MTKNSITPKNIYNSAYEFLLKQNGVTPEVIQKHLQSESVKPDVHLKDIFKALHIINPTEKSVTKQDFETFKAIDSIAIQNDVTPYAVDKIFWLLGSGNFYLSDLKIGNKKKEFISFVIVRE